MIYVESLDLFGVNLKEVPCIRGKGAPTEATADMIGCFYMDTNSGGVYKCVDSGDGSAAWELFGGGKVEPDALTERKGNSLYANVLKGTASGASIRVEDVSPLEHGVKVKVSGVSDPTAVAVMVQPQGKNLFNYKDWVAWCNSGIGNKGIEDATYLGEDCFSYLLWRSSSTQNFTDIAFKENTQYTFTIEWSLFETAGNSPMVVPMLIYYTDGTYSPLGVYYGDQTKFKKTIFTSDANKTISHLAVNRYGQTCTIYVKKNMQIEVGTASTAYEPYPAPVTYPVNADGTCEVTSTSTTLTLTTNTSGAVMDCEYNRDINKVVEQLVQAIISLGGNI